jgi:hypothetical protein
MTSTVSNKIKNISTKTYDGIKDISKKTYDVLTRLSGKSSKLIKSSDKNEDIYQIYNYTINFYNDIFMNDIYNIINERGKNVKTNFITIDPVKKENNLEINRIKKVKDKQQERIIKDYLIPLSYLIYSYIYQKFYIVQQRKDIILENKLNYKMYQYFFSHKNPIIKKVNVYFYNLYNNLLPNNSKNNKNNKNKVNSNGDLILPKEIDQYVIPEIRKGKTKDELIIFLNEVNNKVKKDDVDFNIIIQNLNKLELKTIDINNIFKDILQKFEDSEKKSLNIYQNKLTEYNKEISNEPNSLKKKIELIETEWNKIKSDKDSKLINLGDLNTSKNTIEDSLKKYIDDRSQSKKNISEKLQKNKVTKDEFEKELDKLKKKKVEIDREISTIEARCDKIQNQSKKETCVRDIIELTDNRTIISSKIKSVETSINDIETEIKQTTTIIKNANYDIETKKNIDKLQNNINNINNEIKKITLEINTLKNNFIKKYEELKKEKKILEKLIFDKTNFENDMNQSKIYNDFIKKIIIIDNSKNIYSLIKNLKFSNIKDYKIYLKYKNEYSIILTKYKDLCNIIKLINKNILNINIEKQNIIEENNISIDNIIKLKTFYELKKNNEDNKIFDYISNKNIEINSYIEDEKQLIKILFNSFLTKNTENNLIKNYIDEILYSKINIFNSIIDIIIKFINSYDNTLSTTLKTTLKTYDKTTIKNIYNDIKEDIDLSKKPLFQILYYIYKSIIYEEIIEYNYLLNIINIINNNIINIIGNTYIIIGNDNITKIIKELKYKYDTNYRKFKKENKENNSLKVQLLDYQKYYEEKIIEYKDVKDFIRRKIKTG